MDTPAMALWLARNVHAIACDEATGECKRDIDSLVRRIVRVVDRPPAPRFCGECDTKVGQKICGRRLHAHRDAIEVYCPGCQTTHNIEALLARFKREIDYRIVPREEIIGNQRTVNPELYDTGIMGALDETITWQQFNRWCKDGQLRPHRYVRADGGRDGKPRHAFFRRSPEDVPEYRIGDVRNVRRKMAARAWGKAKVGS